MVNSNQKTAIAIMSFDRPDYLEQVLESILKNDLNGIDIYLFQDNYANTRNIRVADPYKVYSCLSIFSASFPKGFAHFQSVNAGTAVQFDYAEKLLFREMKYDRVMFFEDDMIIQPNYISTLKYMFDKYGDDPRVAMIAAYGASPQNSLERQEQNKHRLAMMGHNWGFGLTREFWERRQPFVQEYLEKFCYGREYRHRDNKQIVKWLAEQGFNRRSTSQDCVKECAGTLLKAIKITCFPNLAKYIGERGMNYNPEMFKQGGFADQVIYEGEVGEMEDLTDTVYEKMYGYLERQKSILM